MRVVKVVAMFALFPLFAGSAFADGSLFGPFQWEGMYFGISTGYAGGNVSVIPNVAPPPGTYSFGGNALSPAGGFGGLDLTINKQWHNTVFGIVADVAMPSLFKGGLWSEDDANDNSWNTRTQLLATLRGRIGYAFGNVLPYVTGGVAYQDSHVMWNYEGSVANYQPNNWGWVLGAGFEYGFDKNWSLGAEYLYMDFGDMRNSSIVFSDDGYYGGKISSNVQLVKFSLKYNFGMPTVH